MKITITLPDARGNEIAAAVAARTGLPASPEGVKEHLVSYLKQMLLKHKRNVAAERMQNTFKGEQWGDLADVEPPPEPEEPVEEEQ